MTNIYLRDLKEENQTDSFIKGIEKLKEQAEKEDKEVIIGKYFDNPYIE